MLQSYLFHTGVCVISVWLLLLYFTKAVPIGYSTDVFHFWLEV